MDTGQRERERESLKSFFSEKRRRKELYDFSWNCTRNHDQITQQYELEFHKSHVNRTFDRERDGNKNSKLIELDSTSKLNLLEEKFKMSLLNFTIKRQLSIINKLIINRKLSDPTFKSREKIMGPSRKEGRISFVDTGQISPTCPSYIDSQRADVAQVSSRKFCFP